MNICIDIGNTNTEIGIVENKVVFREYIKTASFFTEEDIHNFIEKFIKDSLIDTKNVDLVILSSVVPDKNEYFINSVKTIFNKNTFVISPSINKTINLNVDNPNEVGADLLADLQGAINRYSYPCLICDLGTATKILLIDDKGEFSSCIIAPGIGLSFESLSRGTALLPKQVASLPKTIIAKNTKDAMNAGIIYGHLEMVKGLVNKYQEELGYKCKCILCGGFGTFLKEIAPESFIFDDSLTLIGMNILGELNR